jgi:hypothetical protein
MRGSCEGSNYLPWPLILSSAGLSERNHVPRHLTRHVVDASRSMVSVLLKCKGNCGVFM